MARNPIFITSFAALGVALFVLVPRAVPAQDTTTVHTQIVRGSVREAGSQSVVPRARITIEGTKLGAIANEDGEYRIVNVPVGHYTIKASGPGYAPGSQEVVVSSAHQAVMNFMLEEMTMKGDTVTVHGTRALDAVNRVAAVSVTPFSIEDVNRYAAVFEDPSRMAQNFAGVFGRGTTDNYIVVRGGSPLELLWRLDGIEIANPNHFGKSGSSGGLVSAITSNVLGASDFFTGAFPAEYGTRMSAVFDLHTRDGNAERFEGMAEFSFNGVEAIGEGPMPGLEGSSYLLSYRHSTLDILKKIGLLDYNTLPDFDDVTAKLRLRLSANDIVNATLLWGTGSVDIQNSATKILSNGSGIFVGGLHWQHIFSDKFITNVRVNTSQNSYDESFGSDQGIEKTSLKYLTGKAEANYLPSQEHSFQAGIAVQKAEFNLTSPSSGAFFTDNTQKSNVYQAYLNWNWRIVPKLTLNSGIFSQFITYNNSSSYEPRLSLTFSPQEEHSFALGFGVHRQPEPIEFAQAVHYVAGYTYRPSSDIMFKAEGYYKDYSDIPIHGSTKDFYSFLNEGFAERVNYADLINAGKGKAFGAEITLLKHYAEGYYITGTASYVRQQFAGSDGIEHFGAFDNIYIVNMLSGYDFHLSTSSVFTLSEKFTIAGGGMYTPIDLAASAAAGYEVLDSANAYGARNPPYVRLDINAEFHFNWSSTTLTVYVSILNALNIKNINDRFFTYDENGNPKEGIDYDLPILPILGVRYEF